jgi:hypothetical protein
MADPLVGILMGGILVCVVAAILQFALLVSGRAKGRRRLLGFGMMATGAVGLAILAAFVAATGLAG